ncbi:MAG TPA: 1-deoxy-D-xylulose-5-phosphate reductoisomerase [bacterium]|nr:1-deoxy-D-xylulose-5-phosphate reductoisomerase [bacterium]
MKNIVILGSTGTIGKNTLEVVRKRPGEWRVRGLACRQNKKILARQMEEFRPDFVYLEEKDDGFENKFKKTGFFHGLNGLEELVSAGNIDLVIYAVPGITTLKAFISSVKRGQRIGLATKEIMIAAGPIVNRLMEENNAVVLPVDSEHNAIFQALVGEDREMIRKVYLTASGGPFRGKKIKSPTVRQVLSHPVWNMGEKITVDSATMFNKAFELIEAHYLFSLPAEKLDVLIHPEAVIHGMAEMADGTIKGIFSMPDMKYPITFVMDYPNRQDSAWERIDFARFRNFTLEPADRNAKWFSLALEAIEKKGSFPVVLNGANEEAVNMFLKGKLDFNRIPEMAEKILSMHSYKKEIGIEDIFEIDKWAKNKVREIIKEMK